MVRGKRSYMIMNVLHIVYISFNSMNVVYSDT